MKRLKVPVYDGRLSRLAKGFDWWDLVNVLSRKASEFIRRKDS